jgi:hypothetical protein
MISEIFKNSKESNTLSSVNADVSAKKLKKLLGRKSKRPNIASSLTCENKRRCDVCLEFEKYSESVLIECINCKAKCHKRCIEVESKEKLNEIAWECERCKISNKSVFTMR